MSNRKFKNKLEELTGSISSSFKGNAQSEYEYTSTFTGLRIQTLQGLWEIDEHTVAGEPYAELFIRGTFRQNPPQNVQYDATYEFTRGNCIKRVSITGDLFADEESESVLYEYRLTMVLSCDIKGDTLTALPLIGYQCSSLDGKSAGIRELPIGTEPISISIQLERDMLILTDGSDIKRLKRSAL